MAEDQDLGVLGRLAAAQQVQPAKDADHDEIQEANRHRSRSCPTTVIEPNRTHGDPCCQAGVLVWPGDLRGRRVGLLSDHLRIHKAGKETRTACGLILLGCAVVVAALVILASPPPWAWVAVAAAAVPLLARAGRPAGKPIVAAATLPATVQAPSQDVITRALGSLGIAGIDRWLRDGRQLVFPSPVREDGPGWRAEADLPYGVTAAMVIDRREQLTSGLRRPLGAVWPEPLTSEHAGRLELWLGRQDVAKSRQAPWPLLRGGQADIFQPIPFGTDVRGRVVKAALIFANWLLGAIPRQDKTAAVRVLACAVALDPIAEEWIHELKGSGDLDPLEKVCHRFVSGVDDPSIAYAAESLPLLRAEVMRRTERLKALDRELCPDKRVTRQIAAKRSLRLWPIVCFIDEAQNLFAHPGHGKAAGLDAEFIIKIGPAFGVVLIIATQRPDKASLPTGVSGNESTRFCLKVMGQVENDMILGSAYKNGIPGDHVPPRDRRRARLPARRRSRAAGGPHVLPRQARRRADRHPREGAARGGRDHHRPRSRGRRRGPAGCTDRRARGVR
jgi:DNA segregation ATPase FtsK/SpoIIIE, S-DNA-T family